MFGPLDSIRLRAAQACGLAVILLASTGPGFALAQAAPETPASPPPGVEAPAADQIAPAQITSPPAPAPAPPPPSLDDQFDQLVIQAPPPGPTIFGYVPVLTSSAPNQDRWEAIKAEADPELPADWAAFLRAAEAQSPYARVALVNAWVNAHVAYDTDQNVYGVDDYWASLADTLARRRGDCEDFAIAKLELLKMAGFPPADMYLMLVTDLVKQEDHAVLAVREDGELLVLDSDNDRIRPAGEVHRYRPVMSFNTLGAWTFGRMAPQTDLADDQADDKLQPAAAGH